MKQFVYFLFCLLLPASAQPFKVTRDEINIDIKGKKIRITYFINNGNYE